MPEKKRTSRTPQRVKKAVPEKALSKAYESELSYETQVVIVILLLLFFYPVGIVLMWAWMRSWPLWVKLLISLPLLFGILAFFGLMVLFGSILSHARLQQERPSIQHYLLTPAPTLPTTITPSANSAI